MVVGSEGRRAVSAHCRMRPRAGDVQASACGVALSGTSGLFGTPGQSGPQALSPVATVGTACPFRLVRLVDPTGPLSGFRVSTGCSLLRSPLCRVVGAPPSSWSARRHSQPFARVTLPAPSAREERARSVRFRRGRLWRQVWRGHCTARVRRFTVSTSLTVPFVWALGGGCHALGCSMTRMKASRTASRICSSRTGSRRTMVPCCA